MTDPVVTVLPVAPAVKPAYKTTEGWLAFLTAVLGGAVSAGFVGPTSPIVQLGGLLLAGAATAFHSWGRATVKAAAS